MLSRCKIESTFRQTAIGLLAVLTLTLAGCGGGAGGSDTTAGKTTNSAIHVTFSGDFPLSASLPSDEVRYYDIGGLNAGYQYEVSLTTTDPIAFLSGDLGSCLGATSCIVSASEEGDISLQIGYYQDDTDGATYTLNMRPVSHEGTLDAPKDISALMPYEGTVKEGIYNYYVIHGLTPGNSYTLDDGSVSTRIYQDQFASDGFSNNTYIAGAELTISPFTAEGDTVWLRVSGAIDGSFTLTLTDNGLPDPAYVPEGSTELPTELALDTPYDEGQTDNTASYYHVRGLVPNQKYAVDMERLTGDAVALLLYNQAGFGTEVCRDDELASGETAYRCVVPASDAGELWVKVDGSSSERLLGSGYRLTVYASGTTGS